MLINSVPPEPMALDDVIATCHDLFSFLWITGQSTALDHYAPLHMEAGELLFDPETYGDKAERSPSTRTRALGIKLMMDAIAANPMVLIMAVQRMQHELSHYVPAGFTVSK